MFPSTLAPKWPILVSQCNVEWITKNLLFCWFLVLFLLEAVEDRDVTFNQIQWSTINSQMSVAIEQNENPDNFYFAYFEFKGPVQKVLELNQV